MNKRTYYAWLSNDQGATMDVPFRAENKRELMDHIRANYGRGWTVHVMALDIDGDGQSVMGEPYEVKRFRLRG